MAQPGSPSQELSPTKSPVKEDSWAKESEEQEMKELQDVTRQWNLKESEKELLRALMQEDARDQETDSDLSETPPQAETPPYESEDPSFDRQVITVELEELERRVQAMRLENPSLGEREAKTSSKWYNIDLAEIQGLAKSADEWSPLELDIYSRWRDDLWEHLSMAPPDATPGLLIRAGVEATSNTAMCEIMARASRHLEMAKVRYAMHHGKKVKSTVWSVMQSWDNCSSAEASAGMQKIQEVVESVGDSIDTAVASMIEVQKGEIRRQDENVRHFQHLMDMNRALTKNVSDLTASIGKFNAEYKGMSARIEKSVALGSSQPALGSLSGAGATARKHPEEIPSGHRRPGKHRILELLKARDSDQELSDRARDEEKAGAEKRRKAIADAMAQRQRERAKVKEKDQATLLRMEEDRQEAKILFESQKSRHQREVELEAVEEASPPQEKLVPRSRRHEHDGGASEKVEQWVGGGSSSGRRRHQERSPSPPTRTREVLEGRVSSRTFGKPSPLTWSTSVTQHARDRIPDRPVTKSHPPPAGTRPPKGIIKTTVAASTRPKRSPDNDSLEEIHEIVTKHQGLAKF